MENVDPFFNEEDKAVINALNNDIPTALVVLTLYDSIVNTPSDTIIILTKDLREHCCISLAQQKKALKLIKEYTIFDVKAIPKKSSWEVTLDDNSTMHYLWDGVEPPKTEEIKKEIKVNTPPLIEYWNKLPEVTKHLKPNSNEWKSVRKYTKELLSGTFADNKELLEVTDHLKSKKWEMLQLYRALDRLAKLYRADYFPRNKSWLKGLSGLIYNPSTRRSMLLECWIKAPARLAEVEVTTKYAILREALEQVCSEAECVVNPSKIVKTCQDLMKFREKVLDKVINKYYDLDLIFKSEKSFSNYYVKFLKSQNALYEGMLGMHTNTWVRFLAYISVIVYGDNSKVKILTEL